MWTWLRWQPFSLQAGLALALLVGAIVVLGRVWTPYPATTPGVGLPLTGPSGSHWFGTDETGTDVFSKTIAAAWTDVWLTVVAVAIAGVAGSLLGAVAGYWGGILDAVISRLAEILQSFPTLLLALFMVAVTGAGLTNVIVVVAIVGLPGYLRLARAEVMARRRRDFADAARILGARPRRVLFVHILPNCVTPLVAYAAINAAWVAIIVSSLGFIGVGIEPGSAEWGSMIADGRDSIDQYWVSLFPGIGVLLLSAAFYLIGDGVAEARSR
jgi:peptide/nickel transport system permease protein